MSEKPRRWFQIHLSTAVVLMFVAGGLLGLNITKRSEYDGHLALAWHQRGWPCWAIGTVDELPYETREIMNGKNPPPIDSFRVLSSWPRQIRYAAVILNIVTAVGVLLLTAFACEHFRRRRDVRKP